MSNWDKLKHRFRERDRDLDAEFEQFLNESLSEDSVSSPRNKSPDLKAKDFGKPPKAGTSKPWWESSVEDESAKDNVMQSWFKTTATVKEEDEEAKEPHQNDGSENVGQKDGTDDGISTVGTKSDLPQDVGVTMSKDSLDDVGAKSDSDKERQPDVENDYSADEPISDASNIKEPVKDGDNDYSYTEPTGSATSSPSPRQEAPKGTGTDDLTAVTETGMNTQQELREKEEFFKKLEQANKSSLDYQKLNKMLDEESSVIDQNRTGDLLQATGAELGNSIFNATENAQTPLPDKESNERSPEKTFLKPSMLSKVSLMDSLESSMGTSHQQKVKKIRQKQIELPVNEDTETRSFKDLVEKDDEYSVTIESDGGEGERAEVVKEGTGSGTGFLNTSGAGELADLQQALQAAQMATTNDSERLNQKALNKEAIKNVDNASLAIAEIQTNQDLVTSAQTSADGLCNPSDTVPGVGQLRPVIASTADEEYKGFSYSPSISVPQLNKTLALPQDINGGTQVQQGIILSRDSRQDYVKPVLGKEDIFHVQQPGFPPRLSTGFELPGGQDSTEPSVLNEPGLVHGYHNSQEVDKNQETSASRPRGVDVTSVGGNERHGFSLQPVSQMEEGSSDDVTPPAESLKGIKSIVKKRRQTQSKPGSAGGAAARSAAKSSPKVFARPPTSTIMSGSQERSFEEARNRPERSKARKKGSGGGGGVDGNNGSVDRSRFGWKYTPEVTPSKGKRRMPGKEKKNKPERSAKKEPKDINQTSPAQLMASVESFANYLNTFVLRETPETPTSRVGSIHEDAHGLLLGEGPGRLTREQGLQKEVEHWQTMWQEERKQKEELLDELAEKDKEWKRREQTLRFEYKKEINDLKQKVFVLESKLKDAKAQVDNKKRVAEGGSLKGMSEKELRKLEKEIREQDQLLTGYQQENERLYGDLKEAQSKAKTTETQMFRENQKLASEVASLKEKLERKEGTFGATGAAALGAERIHQLHSQVQLLKTNEQEMRKEIEDLENERGKLSKEVKNLERERDMAVRRAEEALGTNSQAFHDMESTHAATIERLNRKLKWYAENQELLDKDDVMLKKKNEEVEELRELVKRLEAERGRTTMEKDKKEKERVGDAKRIQDLERQVREMEQIIKRRYPNSIPALIYAASAAPGDGKPLKSNDSPKKTNTPSYAFLENRVKKLERELEEREEDWSRSFRALEQKYNAMQLEYEGQLTELHRELNDAREKVTSYTHTRARATAVEKDLETMREKSERKTQELLAEINVLREALRASKSNVAPKESKGGKTKRGRKDSGAPLRIDEDLEARLTVVNEECERKARMIEDLRSTCAQLQRQRKEMLQEVEISESSKNVLKSLEEKLSVVNVENRQLRDQVSQMSIEMDQQRVRYQGSLAEVERMARQEREESHDELRSLRTQHKKELDSLREEYAIQHSRSKMAELNNKIASLEIVIERLKDKLAKSAETEAELASKKVHEEILKQEINQLKNDLKKAKQFHTPEMQHFTQLEDKIAAMETRHSQREQELQTMLSKVQLSADKEKDEVLCKWRNLLRKKTEETERFRVELDGILSVLEELRQQGVVIPAKKRESIHYL